MTQSDINWWLLIGIEKKWLHSSFLLFFQSFKSSIHKVVLYISYEKTNHDFVEGVCEIEMNYYNMLVNFLNRRLSISIGWF